MSMVRRRETGGDAGSLPAALPAPSGREARADGGLAPRWHRAASWIVAGLLVSGCAGSPAPLPVEEMPFLERTQTESQGALTVTAAVPTRDEAEAVYGEDLAALEMQPIWIEVRNDGQEHYWLLPAGLDPAYFSAPEAAYPFGVGRTDESRARIERRFQELQFRNPIPPGSTVSGFVIVNRDEAFRAVDVDLVSRGDAKSFSYIVIDPSFRGDYTLVNFDELYGESELVHLDDKDALRSALEQLPCCTTNKRGSAQGDPLNLVLIGDEDDLFPAFVRRGWHGTEVVWSAAVWRTIGSFLQGTRYRYSPISPLYVYGRRQDIALQKARGTIHERNHLRLWLTPIRFRGRPVWIGQISRDIGVKFTTKSPTISTHVIDPDVDEARRYLVEDLAYSQALTILGYASGVGEVTRDAPRMNLVGDPYHTDGLRAVMFFERRPQTLEDIDFLEWERVERDPDTGSRAEAR